MELSSPSADSARLVYSTSKLLRLRQQQCIGFPRNLRRQLFSLGIRNKQHTCSRPQSIPVRVTTRRSRASSDSRKRELLKVPLTPRTRARRTPPAALPTSMILSNLRSISNKFDEVSLKIGVHRPDVAIFTESWLSPDVPDSALSITSYTLCRKDRSRNGGGIITYISERYSYRILNDSDVPSLSSCDTEFLPIIFTSVPFFVISLYHPFWNDSAKDDKCISCISDMLDFVMTTSCFDSCKMRLLICGDFNGLKDRYDEISQVTQLKAVVEVPTRGSNILDQFFCNFSFNCSPEVLPPIGKSDHSVVLWSERPAPRPTPRKVVIRKVTPGRRALLEELIARTDWLALVQAADNVDSCASSLLNCLFSLYDFCFPFRTVRFHSNDPPWMKPSLKILIDDRDRAHSRGQFQKYLRLRAEVARHTCQLKEQFLKSALATKDSRIGWRSLRVVGQYNKSPFPHVSVEQLNEHFVSNFQESTDNFPLVHDDLPSSPVRVSSDEVFSLLKQLKNKSPGPDGVPAWLLRDFAFFLSPAVAFLFNWSLRVGQVPHCFKVANVTPVPKCSPALQPSSFRPISLLPILSKVLEKVVARKWIMPCISDRIDPSQFAYIPGEGKGTTCALTLLYHDIAKFLDSSSGCVRLLSIDFSKAFDKILHSKILATLTAFKFPVDAIFWISSFLKDRFQRVRVGEMNSSWQPVLSGVPQGSVLGPLLFCIFVDSLHSISRNSVTYKYADDVNIVHFIRDTEDDALQLEYNNVLDWSAKHKLPINESKCSVLDIITKKSISTSPVVGPCGTVVPQVSSVRVLGVIFQDNLKWNSHVESVVRKANKRFYLIRNLKRAACDSPLILLAYNSVIRPLFLYAYPSFCNFSVYLQNRFQKFEKRVFRIAGATNDLSVIEAAEKYCQNLFAKVSRNTSHSLRRCFTQQSSNTRQSNKLRPLRGRSVRFSRSFTRFAR